MSTFSLKVVEGGLKGEEFLLDKQGLCLVGRGESCSISIPKDKDGGISRRHCLLIVDPPNLRVRDLYSTNGTYVNGHRLIPAPIGDNPDREHPNDRFLLEGDRIAISNIVMEMHVVLGIEATQELSIKLPDDALQNSQTTKTKLIEFSRGKTRPNSLIPETNLIDSENLLISSENGIMEETHLFLSLPITEPIPRPNKSLKQNQQTSGSFNEKDKESVAKDKKATNNPINDRGDKMAEKPDMSIIMGSGNAKDNTPPAVAPSIETIPNEDNEKTVEQTIDSTLLSAPEPEVAAEEKTNIEPLAEEKPTAPATPVMPSIPEGKPTVRLETPKIKKQDAPPPPVSVTENIGKTEIKAEEVIPSEEEILEESPNTPVAKEEETSEKPEPPPLASPTPSLAQEPTKIDSGRKRLFDTNKMKAMEELAGALAHDYNKQLTVVMGYTELLKNAKDPEKIQEYANTIFRSAQLSTELTQQLLMFASHDHDTGGTSVNLSEMITEIVSVMKHTSGRNVAVEFTPQSESKSLYTIGNQLEIYEALLNIAFNSIDAISGIGSLAFKIESVALNSDDTAKLAFDVEPGDFVKITIRDTGLGISDDNFERIFEPFFTTKQKEQALGMGLTVSYGVVKNHSGAIDVVSKPGKGTTFEILFPSSEKSNGKLADKVNPREKLADMEITVLLLNDEENMRSLIIEMLTLLKIEVKECADPKDVVAEYTKDTKGIDMVIIDMNIPERGELDIYKKLKEVDKDVKVLFSSGYKPSAQSQREMTGGNVEILPKPYSADELYYSAYELLK